MLKLIVQLIIAAILIGAGFFIRGLIPAGGPPPGMMGYGEMPPPGIVAIQLKEAPLDVQSEYIATVEAVQDVMVRSEVSGYLDQVHFSEGSYVEKGSLLFSIDREQYQALVEAREADLARARAEMDRAEKFLKRMQEANERSVSQSDLDTAESAQLQAVAGLKQAEANLNLAQIDLAYAEIRAPISGRIGEAMLTRGNYINAAADTLARIVQIDPVRVAFSMTDRAYLDIRSQVLNGRVEDFVAQVRLPNGIRLPAKGIKDFDDNAMNPNTGTMAVRYMFDNPDGLLVPGGYVTMEIGKAERPLGIRVPQRAVLVGSDGSYVLTVDEAGTIGAAPITLGDTMDTDVVVESGLKSGDRVVVDGLQKVQPGMTAAVTLMEVAQ
jgi:RND family efflux transporter MFP subunit